MAVDGRLQGVKVPRYEVSRLYFRFGGGGLAVELVSLFSLF